MPRDLLADNGPRDLLADKKPAPQKPSKPERTWLDTAADVGKGMYLGAVESAGGLMQKLSNTGALNVLSPIAAQGMKAGGRDAVMAAHSHAKDMYSDTGAGGVAGRIMGNIAGTAPLAPALRGIGMLPNIAKSVGGRFGAAGLAGAGQGAVIGGTALSEDPESKFNVKGAAMGAVAGGAFNPIAQALPILRTRMRNDELVKDAYENIIGKISQKIAKSPTAQEAEKIAARTVKTMATKVKGQEKKAWDNLFKDSKNVPIGTEASTQIKAQVSQFIEQHGYQMTPSMRKWLNTNMLGKGDLTFGQLKQLRSGFRSNIKDSLWKQNAQGGSVHDAAKKSNELYDDLTHHLRGTAQRLGKEELFVQANTFSKNANMFQNEFSEELAGLAVKRANVGKFIDKFFSSKSGEIAAGRLAQLPQGTGRALTANSMKQLALKHTGPDGTFNIKSFFNEVSRDPRQLGMLDGNPQYKALKGLMNVLQDSQQAGAVNLGSASKFGMFTSIGNNMLNHFTSAKSAGLRKMLQQYSLIKKNQKLKQFLGNRIVERMMRIGVISGNSFELKNESKNKNSGSNPNTYPRKETQY